jgi:hypothetical protein
MDPWIRIHTKMLWIRNNAEESIIILDCRLLFFIVLQSLYGILQDDYDYGSVREQLEPSLQQFIRTACRHPASIHPDLIHNILLDLSTSEKVNKTSGFSKLTEPPPFFYLRFTPSNRSTSYLLSV